MNAPSSPVRFLAFGFTIAFGIGVIGLVGYALADRELGTAKSNTATLTHGDWRRLPDGGFRYSVCGSVKFADGGTARVPLLSDGDDFRTCDDCEPGGWSSAPATCAAAWKAARGL